MGKREMLGGECRHAEEEYITSAFSAICFSFRLPSRVLCSTSFPWMTRLNQPRGNAVLCRSLSQFLIGHINIATVLGHLSDDITWICRHPKQTLVMAKLPQTRQPLTAAMLHCLGPSVRREGFVLMQRTQHGLSALVLEDLSHLCVRWWLLLSGSGSCCFHASDPAASLERWLRTWHCWPCSAKADPRLLKVEQVALYTSRHIN